MLNEDQKKALALLAEIWELSPDVRLGQLLAHLGFLGENFHNQTLGYIDDEDMLNVLARHRSELQARFTASPEPTLLSSGSAATTQNTKVA